MCKAGFAGAACAVSIGSCNPACSVNGLCDPKTNRCACKAGWTGLDCSEMIQSCKNHCSFKGLCMNGFCMCGAGWQGEDCSVPFFVPGADMPVTKDDGGAAGADAGGQALGLLANSPSNTDLQATSNSTDASGDASLTASGLMPQPNMAALAEALPSQDQSVQPPQPPIAGLFEGTEMDDDGELDSHGVAGVGMTRPDSGSSLAIAPSVGPAAAGSGGMLGTIDTSNMPSTGL